MISRLKKIIINVGGTILHIVREMCRRNSYKFNSHEIQSLSNIDQRILQNLLSGKL